MQQEVVQEVIPQEVLKEALERRLKEERLASAEVIGRLLTLESAINMLSNGQVRYEDYKDKKQYLNAAVTPQEFRGIQYRPESAIWTAIATLQKTGRPLDITTLHTELDKQNIRVGRDSLGAMLGQYARQNPRQLVRCGKGIYRWDGRPEKQLAHKPSKAVVEDTVVAAIHSVPKKKWVSDMQKKWTTEFVPYPKSLLARNSLNGRKSHSYAKTAWEVITTAMQKAKKPLTAHELVKLVHRPIGSVTGTLYKFQDKFEKVMPALDGQPTKFTLK